MFRIIIYISSETWAPNASDLQRFRRNDRAMIRWICGAKLEDEISSAVLHQKLDVDEIMTVLRTRRLRWYGRHFVHQLHHAIGASRHPPWEAKEDMVRMCEK